MAQFISSWKQTRIFTHEFFFCLGVKGNVQGNLFKVITKEDTHYYIQASSKAERAEWIEAIKKLTWRGNVFLKEQDRIPPPYQMVQTRFPAEWECVKTFSFFVYFVWLCSSLDHNWQWCYFLPCLPVNSLEMLEPPLGISILDFHPSSQLVGVPVVTPASHIIILNKTLVSCWLPEVLSKTNSFSGISKNWHVSSY